MWFVWLSVTQRLRWPHAFGHTPPQGVVGKGHELLQGGGAGQPCAGEHVGELALRVVGEVLGFVAAGFLGDEVAMPIPGEAFVFQHQQAVRA